MGNPADASVEPPIVEIAWRADEALLSVVAPPGRKVAAEAPAGFTLRWTREDEPLERSLTASSDGRALVDGLGVRVPAGELRGAAVDGQLDVGLCDLAGTTCVPTSWALAGSVGAAKRGAVRLVVYEPPTPSAAFGTEVTAAAADAAFANAKASGRAVLLDFSAVWCPPCNRLAAEVLHGPPASELGGYEVAVLDVDHPSSFALKDRYDVGGYPTVVAVDADGNELARIVGYSDRERFLAWLAGAATSNDAADRARDPADLEPERAATVGLSWVSLAEPDRAGPFLARADEGGDTVDRRMLRLALAPSVDDLQWLLAHAPDRAPEWVGSALALDEAEDDVQRAADLALSRSRGLAVAELLTVLAYDEGDAAEKRRLASIALALAEDARTGDPMADKGFLEWIADLRDLAGDADGAVALLEEAARAWPDEPTFDLMLAPLLTRLGRHDEALASAERAVERAWGDNRLRAIGAKAKALIAAGRADEGRALVEAVLAEPAPPAELEVRTHRYRQRLGELLAP